MNGNVNIVGFKDGEARTPPIASYKKEYIIITLSVGAIALTLIGSYSYPLTVSFPLAVVEGGVLGCAIFSLKQKIKYNYAREHLTEDDMGIFQRRFISFYHQGRAGTDFPRGTVSGNTASLNINICQDTRRQYLEQPTDMIWTTFIPYEDVHGKPLSKEEISSHIPGQNPAPYLDKLFQKLINENHFYHKFRVLYWGEDNKLCCYFPDGNGSEGDKIEMLHFIRTLDRSPSSITLTNNFF